MPSIEDDSLVVSAVPDGLRLHGFTVEHAEPARLADAATGDSQFDVNAQ